MKKKPGFALRTVCNESFLVAEGIENIDFSNLIVLNESSAFLWQSVAENEEFTADTLVTRLLEEYDIDEATARADVNALIEQMVQAGVITE